MPFIPAAASCGVLRYKIKLHVGRVGAFLDYVKTDLPSLEIAENYRSKLIRG
jgi:hypothetical protein